MNQAVVRRFKNSLSARPLFSALARAPRSFLLESTRAGSARGRFSFFGYGPFARLSCRGLKTSFVSRKTTSRGVEFAGTLRDVLKEFVLKKEASLAYPFLCGAVGYLGYDFGFRFEDVRRCHASRRDIPEALFDFYDCVVGIDREKGEVIVFSSGFPEHGSSRKKRARRRCDEVCDILEAARRRAPAMSCREAPDRACRLRSNFTRGRYIAAVEKAKAYIAAGDIYQVNLSQEFRGPTSLDDWQIYNRLTTAFPVDFSAFFKDENYSIISASPERFLSFDGTRVVTRPMKGTRPRVGVARDDARYRRELLESGKERAELLMIVDLERNDLGRVCDYGSIHLRRKRVIESYRTVFQAISEIEGRLHPGRDRWDLLRACFPGGSITGCPKIRAMQIIEELEPGPRGIYTGALGYISFHNTLDFNILIRTLLKKRKEVSFHVGGGIVADSDPSREYEETLIKARALLEALTGRQEI